MNAIIKELVFQSRRANKAYELYKIEKYYHQALRIYYANRKIYKLLVENAKLWNDSVAKEVIEFIFHLEDWFIQFHLLAKELKPGLEDVFVFAKLEHSFSYPKGIIDKLKKLE